MPSSDFDAADRLETRAQARASLMLGEWAARLMGLKDVDAYAQVVVRTGAEPGGEEAILRRVSHDLADSGLAVGAAEVAARHAEFLAQARSRPGLTPGP
ncbi:MAG: DUF1476 family protein [Alphaproteobacteria bacterium]|nr:DUF1476 family protein [Alphaproteobacteria bacterium]